MEQYYNITMNATSAMNVYNRDTDPAYELRFSVTTTALLSVAYAMVFILGLIGNGFVIAVVCRCRGMRYSTNLFIVNLACADLLVIVLCLPFTLVGNLIPAWILGNAICKGVSYLQGVSVSASINTLMAISIERCLVITSLTFRSSLEPRYCGWSVLFIWTFALLINLPWVIVFRVEPIGIDGSLAQRCTEFWSSQESESLYFVFANLCVCYLIPLAVISVCYYMIWRRLSNRQLPGEAQGGQSIIDKSKIKAVKMIFVVIVTFAISWLPLYTVFCIIKFGFVPNNETYEKVIATLIPISQWLGASNSCINPIYYAFFNRKFRIGFKAILTSKSCCGPLRLDDRWTSCCTNSVRFTNVNVTSVPLSQIRREKFRQTSTLLDSFELSTNENYLKDTVPKVTNGTYV